MAFRFASQDDGELPINHDINVTPFIDVMLVLLIIFMVAAPLATADIKVDLPVANAAASAPPVPPVTVTIAADGSASVDGVPVAVAGLGVAVKAKGAGGEARVFLRADRKVAYEQIMAAMNALRGAGLLKVALVGLEGGGA